MFLIRCLFCVVLLFSVVLAQEVQLRSQSSNPSVDLSASWTSKGSVYESVLNYKFCGKSLSAIESARFVHSVESGVKYDQIHKLDKMHSGCIQGSLVIHEPFSLKFKKLTLLLLDKTQDQKTEDKLIRYRLTA